MAGGAGRGEPGRPVVRPRRLRATPRLRRLVSEHRPHPDQLILPVFVVDQIAEPCPIAAMPGVVQHKLDSIVPVARACAAAGLGGIMIFGLPAEADKDASGSQALAPDGILNRAIGVVREAVGDDLLVMSDVCLDEFTDHGHCGVLDDLGRVDNDATLPLYAEMAVRHAEAGAHVVAPSGMMDGQVTAIRTALDAAGHTDTAILAYAAKYASAFYGPFREAVNSSLTGDRRTYQMDPANAREALRELALDEAEGADMIMVKPALGYLDVVAAARAATTLPVAAYNVSGEYAMLEAAAANGWLDRDRAIVETLTSITRAGASIVLTYWALEYATRLA